MTDVATAGADWRSMIESRLQCVLSALNQLSDSKSGHRELHDARVVCRKAEAALRLCCDLLPARRSRRLRQHVQAVRRTTNKFRDQDVLQKWFIKQKGAMSDKAFRIVRQQRDELLPRMIKSIGNLRHLRNSVSHVTRAARDATSTCWQSCLARSLLSEVLRFLQRIPKIDSASDNLHAFRIAGKRLRYACEFATEVLPQLNFRSLLLRLKQMQQRLGQIHDTAARIEQLTQLNESERAAWLRQSLNEQQQLTKDWDAWRRSVPWENAVGSAITQVMKVIRTSS